MKRSRLRPALGAAVLILVIIGSAAAATGCGSQAGAASGPVKLTEADNGKTITVNNGDLVQVALPGNPTTGYSWSVTMSNKDDTVLQQQGDPVYVQQSTDPSLVGGGGTFTFTFKAVGPGQVILNFGYARPWEQGVAPIQTYSATIDVK